MDRVCVSLTGEVRGSKTASSGMMEAIKSLWFAAVIQLTNLNDAITILLQEELQKDGGGGGSGGSGLVLDCIVCLAQVSQGEQYKELPNCKHGPQFHTDCMEAWLKNHSTCPLCRRHIPRPFLQRLHNLCQHLFDAILSYFHSVLENVCKSIGELH